jgi:predicted esterase YcpF (UPF0227 family)
MTNYVYLHGFNSSPLSLKAQETRIWLEQNDPTVGFHCPDLSPHPQQALIQAHALIASLPADTLLIGSSLGGFYAAWLAHKLDRKAVLINPAVLPQQDLQRFGGEQQNPYSGETYFLDASDFKVLEAHQVAHPDQRRFWLILGSSDEVLDWQQAAVHYQGCKQTIFNGDDHRLDRWRECLPLLASFAAPSTEKQR